MNKKSVLHSTVLAAFLATYGATAVAMEEVEFNSPIQSAQQIIIGSDGSVMVNAELSSTGDIDYFSFQGTANDTVTIDIDGAWKGAVAGIGSVDTMIALFGPEPAYSFGDYYRHAQSNDMTSLQPLDDGSLTKRDSFIQFTLPRDGTYTVGVSTSGKSFNNGGSLTTLSQTSFATGSYKLTVSGVTPAMMQVNIDVKPGQSKDTRLNPKSRGVVPVAILSKEGFHPMEVDHTSLGFGASGEEKSLQGCHKQGKDLNGDGVPDLVCNFDNEKTNFEIGETTGIVKGKARGKMFEGRGDLKVLPEGRE